MEERTTTHSSHRTLAVEARKSIVHREKHAGCAGHISPPNCRARARRYEVSKSALSQRRTGHPQYHRQIREKELPLRIQNAGWDEAGVLALGSDSGNPGGMESFRIVRHVLLNRGSLFAQRETQPSAEYLCMGTTERRA